MERGPRMRVGMALAIEPMLTAGSKFTLGANDGWTVLTRDGSPAAHFEHTVCLTEQGLWVTTAADGGKAGLAPFGVDGAPLTARLGPRRPGELTTVTTRDPRRWLDSSAWG